MIDSNTEIGSVGIAIGFVVLFALFARRRRWWLALELTLATGGALLLDTVLKAIVHRARPIPIPTIIPAQAYSFPSGHATVSTAFCFYLVYLVWQEFSGWERALYVLATVLLVLAIGASRLYLGVHYFSDIVGGYLVGFIWLDAVVISVHFLSRESDEPTGRSPSEGRVER